MATRRSRRKGIPSRAICNNQDFISRLPDDVLTHILSYLPTKSSVATCVLSKRWSRVWISVPNLDFNGCWSDCSVRQAEIVNFIDRFLRLNTVMSVRTINLDCGKIREIARVNAWIAALGERNAKIIGLKWPKSSLISLRSSKDGSSQFYSLPDKFYIQRNLVQLKLSYVALKVPKSVKFPKLKMIDLRSTHLFDGDSLKNLLSGSPVLGSFFMHHEGDSDTLHIYSSSLRVIDISIYYNNLECELIFDTPNLTDLSLTDYGYPHSTYNVINLSSLVRAYLCITEDGEKLLKLLAQIAHVEDLMLRAFVMNRLPRASLVNLPVFPNLNHLDVVFELDESWEVLSHLFQCTPYLIGFTLTIEETGYVYPCNWCDPSEVPQCFLSCLESVEIIGFEEEEDKVLPMISYFLKSAMVLKKLKYSIHRPVEIFLQDDKFRTTLMSLPKSSETCEVKYNCSSDDDSS